jgi:hypothetical protein
MNCAKRRTHETYKDDEYICDVWTIDDVLINAKENHDINLSNDQAKNVLLMMMRKYDANNGLTYDTLDYWTEQEIKDA